ncbi:MAG: hydrogenase nickel incorporation protein HypB [Limnochordaceae bacterium]|nr:hydrogenase nickel incorporation protein HypB [Limnochordaceae bacterium]
MEIPLVEPVLKSNDRLAALNRQRLRQAGLFTINLISSPGAGKTTLLEKTIPLLRGLGRRSAVLEGDLFTTLDAERIERTETPVVQINTRGGCHLDAALVGEALEKLDLRALDYLWIENVGNLVCPAGYDLGEDLTVVVLSTPEGDDKPAKYTPAFLRAEAVVLTKLDLLSLSGMDVNRLRQTLRRINPQLELIPVCARTGEGMDRWIAYLEQQFQQRTAIDKPIPQTHHRGA